MTMSRSVDLPLNAETVVSGRCTRATEPTPPHPPPPLPYLPEPAQPLVRLLAGGVALMKLLQALRQRRRRLHPRRLARRLDGLAARTRLQPKSLPRRSLPPRPLRLVRPRADSGAVVTKCQQLLELILVRSPYRPRLQNPLLRLPSHRPRLPRIPAVCAGAGSDTARSGTKLPKGSGQAKCNAGGRFS